jgi:hypothetical protein
MRWFCAFAAVSALALSSAAFASNYQVTFAQNLTIPLADMCPMASVPCLENTDSSLSVVVVNGVAEFTGSLDLPGPPATTLNVSFDLPDIYAPSGVEAGDSPYFTGAGLTNASWDTSMYPYVTFWSNEDGAGISIGSQPGDGPTDNVYFTDFGSEQSYLEGSPSLFTLTGTPEPASWAMLLVGATATGAGVRRRRAKTA